MRKKDEIPEEVINYCIDNKVSIAEGMKAITDMKLKKLEENTASLKKDVLDDIFGVQKSMLPPIEKITKEDMDDIDAFLNYLNSNLPD